MLSSVSFIHAQVSKNMQPQELTEAKRTEMKKLGALVGQWSGSGWILHEKGKEIFNGTETVQRKLEGLALLVEGNFKNKEGVIIHETLAVLSPNTKTKNYDFRTYLANGINGEQEFKAVDRGWQWGFQIQNGAIRYDIKIENDSWIETGEMSRDNGKTWMKFFEMNLKRVK
jgi:hypothetical protein